MSAGDASEIEIGILSKPHGIRGGIQLRLHNPSSGALEHCDLLIVKVAGQRKEYPYKIAGRGKGGAIIVQLHGIHRREEAEDLRGATIWASKSAVEPTEDDEYLYVDLVGCSVLDEEERVLGEVIEVLETGASPVLSLRDGQSELMIPMVDEWVTEVDLERKIIKVTGGEQWRALNK